MNRPPRRIVVMKPSATTQGSIGSAALYSRAEIAAGWLRNHDEFAEADAITQLISEHKAMREQLAGNQQRGR